MDAEFDKQDAKRGIQTRLMVSRSWRRDGPTVGLSSRGTLTTSNCWALVTGRPDHVKLLGSRHRGTLTTSNCWALVTGRPDHVKLLGSRHGSP
eukprot:1177569-Prorocentrum_minimum.AAC.2